MSSLDALDITPGYADGAPAAEEKVNAAHLDSDLVAVKAWINGQLKPLLDSFIRDDDTFADQFIRLRNLHQEILTVIAARDAWLPKVSVAAATTANVTLSGEQTIDGVVTSASRVLVKDQTAPAENGIYVTGAGAWTRATDADAASEIGYACVFVPTGNANAGTAWVVTAAVATITLGTTAITWAKFYGPFNTQTVQFVDTIAALKALVTHYDTVYVRGYYAAGDGAGGMFRWNSADATADNGGTVIAPNSGTGRWNRILSSGPYNVKLFGAKGDWNGSTGTDDTAAIQAAITALEALGRGGTLLFPLGAYRITSHLRVSKGLRLLGDGMGNDTTSASQPNPPATYLIFDGASGSDDMILVQSATANEFIYFFGIDHLALLGNNKANRGLWMRSPRYGDIGTVWAERCIIAGGVMDDGNGVLCASNRIGRWVYTGGSNAACINSHGMWIRSSNGVGCTQTVADSIGGAPGANGYALIIGDHDSGWFSRVGNSVYFQAGGQDSQTRAARKNVIGFVNGIVYVQAAAAAADGPRNVVLSMQSESNSVQIDTALGTYATIHYSVVDRNDGDFFETRRYAMSDEMIVPLAFGYASTGSPAIGSNGSGLAAPAVAFDAAATEGWTIAIPPPKKWAAGYVTGVRLWHSKVVASVGAAVVADVSVALKGDGGGLGSGFTTVQQTVSVLDATNDLQKTNILFTAPGLTYILDELIVLRIRRIGGDAADTYTNDWMLLGAELLYTSKGPDSDGVKRWDVGLDQLAT